VRELQAVRRKHQRLTKKTLAEANRWLKQRGDFGESFEVLAEFEVPATTDNFGLILRFGTNAQVRITCDPGLRRISLDRSKSGRTDFHPTFIRAIEAPIEIREQRMQLRFIVDASSIELFCQQGEVCLTALIFPPKGSRQLELFSDQSEESVACNLLEVWRLEETR
jgi:fructan beta-fructosidase